MPVSRRHLLSAGAGLAVLALAPAAWAAGPVKIGILIPGSKSDKG